ncbi:hypothetical protein ABE65_007605 [Fictibacillus phosphorivorans]|uniref:Uncharacterized protein n=1 Tax=Fictibacillus phosphorivorans TaxID=1221500 RepID=A0A160IMK9_9BACL|nr:hypothetical protein [Fictibacillus phosphorivorans]ANC76672.1 hypothetical protein ABE65_007605 [Fictibacillus phosphorivorans]
MSSLFKGSCCGGNGEAAGGSRSRNKSCVCELLHNIANTNGNFCSMAAQQRLLIVLKGASTPLSLGGETTPTIFTLVRFDDDSSCAVFSYLDATTGLNQTFVIDCRCICGIVCVPQTTNGNGAGALG